LSVHSGSRTFGRQIHLYLTELNKKELTNETIIEGIYLVAYTQVFAKMNRHALINRIMDEIGDTNDEYIETFHNYIDYQNCIFRKGAISAQKDEKCIVSLNMQEGILICTGLGNEDYNYSCCHGCGRDMSRKDVVKSSAEMKRFEKSMEGIISLDIKQETLDEAPFAYKNSLMIMQAIKETIMIDKTLEVIANVKG
jgi:tRNA-splicing ligase RtcB